MNIRQIPIHPDTNIDFLTKEEMKIEAAASENQTRVQLLLEIHNQLEDSTCSETKYGYDPINDMSFTGEFEAIGA